LVINVELGKKCGAGYKMLGKNVELCKKCWLKMWNWVKMLGKMWNGVKNVG
jgi:hypothetical protein